MNDLLTLEALKWLESINYNEKTHKERIILIQAARIAYPDTTDNQSEEEILMKILRLV